MTARHSSRACRRAARSRPAAWIRVAPPELVVDPGKDGIGPLHPDGAAGVDARRLSRPGSCSSSCRIRATPGPQGREVQFRSRVATLIYVNVGPAADQRRAHRSRDAHDPGTAARGCGARKHQQAHGPHEGHDDAARSQRQAGHAGPACPTCRSSPRASARSRSRVTAAGKPLPAGEYRVEVRIDVGMAALVVGETTLKVSR